MPRHLTLNALIVIAASTGVAGGLALAAYGTATPVGVGVLYAARLTSTLFLDLLTMIVVPLVFASLVCGVASLGEHRDMRSVWRWTLAFFAASMLVAVVIGLTASNVFRPGEGQHLGLFADATRNYQAQHMPFSDYFAEFLHGLFKNPFAALAQGDILAVVMFAIICGVALAFGPIARHAHHLLFPVRTHSPAG